MFAGDTSTVRESRLPVAEGRARLRAVGLAAALVGIACGWRYGEDLSAALLGLWRDAVLPAFYTLHVSGLPFCS